MVEGNIIPNLDSLVSKLNNNRCKKVEYMEPTAIFFVSIDIVNSTMYKTTHINTWSRTMELILSHIISSFETSTIGGYSYWKSLGDEILYTKNIVRLSDIPVILDEISSKLNNLNQMIEDCMFCGCEDRKILGVKATAWICDVSSSAQFTRNVLTQYEIKDNRKQIDYAGPSIDIGFRVSKHTMKNRMVISWALAYLLLQILSSEEFAKKVNVIAEKTLAGVWHGKPYPIIMYHNNELLDFDASIVGCDSEKEKGLREYLENKPTLGENEPYFCYAQKVIIESVKGTQKIARINDIISIIERDNYVNFIDIAI